MFKEFEYRTGDCYKNYEGHYIGDGNDSIVFKKDDLVKRAYRGGSPSGLLAPSKKSLFLYRDITQKAYELSKAEKFTYTFPFTHETFKFTVNPFIDMYECGDCGYIEAESLYIPGNSLIVTGRKFDPKELDQMLRIISLDMNSKLGVFGVSLERGNLKFTDENKIVVTDLCADIKKLKPLFNLFAPREN